VNAHGTLGDGGVMVPDFIVWKEAVVAYRYARFEERVYMLGKQVECLRVRRVLQRESVLGDPIEAVRVRVPPGGKSNRQGDVFESRAHITTQVRV